MNISELYLVTLFVEFRCTDYKILQNSVFTYSNYQHANLPKKKTIQTFYQCYSFTPGQFETLSFDCLIGRVTFI